tara:strand:- start:826 stop:1401 length:576 start_codon:yes stop_codon:yes gene_type:complete
MTYVMKFDNLDDVYSNIWSSISRGVNDRHSDFHTFSLATSIKDDINNRTVVLRGHNQELGKVIFHTHASSEKIKDISANPKVECMFYSKKNKTQIRFKGKAIINQNNEVCMKKWSSMSDQSKLCYFQNIDPGLKIIDPKEVNQKLGNELSKDFSIIEVDIEKTDWLYLSHEGHLRAIFINNQKDSGYWVAP